MYKVGPTAAKGGGSAGRNDPNSNLQLEQVHLSRQPGLTIGDFFLPEVPRHRGLTGRATTPQSARGNLGRLMNGPPLQREREAQQAVAGQWEKAVISHIERPFQKRRLRRPPRRRMASHAGIVALLKDSQIPRSPEGACKQSAP